ncbi:MAG: nucleoside-diphosphate sugar epimerase/dehydratase [Steroidobacteraceae bacterium]
MTQTPIKDPRKAGFRHWLLSLPRGGKQAILLSIDTVLLALALWLAVSLKLGVAAPVDAGLLLAGAIAWVLCIPVFASFGLYRAITRFMGLQAALGVLAGASLAAVALIAYRYFETSTLLPTTAVAIFVALTVLLIGGSRLVMRHIATFPARAAERVVIYGAGNAGARLAVALRGSEQYWPVAFVDDDPSLHGKTVLGLKVWAPDALADLIKRRDVSQLLLALPSVSRRERRRVLDRLEKLPLRVRTVPDINDILAGAARLEDIREVDVSDLLGRDAVPPNQELFDATIRGKSVLVTGAGGSIGSELCRQIIRQGPRRLLLLEMSELALYEIERELRALMHAESIHTEMVPLLGNAHHKFRVKEIFETFGVQTVYHAAAYKHVPIVEQNIVEGLHNNIFSTWYTAEVALECKVDTFVLVSTDKAVNPTNVMGATKRFAEMVLQGLQERSTHTRFCMVRFGNVLESSGSVVPLFREQIRAGGPVTVTHPDVIRYFMTIPEAAQLVIQAGAMAVGGDVFVLDMGKPIKIADLARRMIQLSGFEVRDEHNPDGDIAIKYTGLRAAEKLFEELLIGKNVTGTQHPMIMRAVEHALPWQRTEQYLTELMTCARKFDCEAALSILAEAVAEYRPAQSVVDLVWNKAGRSAPLPETASVTDLASARRRQSDVNPRG